MKATAEPGDARRATRWVSRGLETLIATGGDRQPFDVLIVGSGYGGAVAADRLAGCSDAGGHALRIAVLERGREYLRGAFPGTLADLAGHVRFTTPGGERARGRLEGLFDLRLGGDMSVLMANGVGGGSLINAGVLLFPKPEVFAQPPWPRALDVDDLQQRALELQRQLGALRDDGKPNVIGESTLKPARRDAFGKFDGFVNVPLSIALADDTRTVAGTALNKCIACGDCFTGCNQGAKNSLDLGLLRRAQQRGVAIYSGATVSQLGRLPDGHWELQVWHTDLALRRRMAGPLKLRARRVVVAAGTLGSTELLLRSAQADPALRFSSTLGQRFSGNGDMLAAMYATREAMNAAPQESVQPSKRQVGPTITGMLDWRDGVDQNRHCLVQDLAVPAALRRLLEEAVTTADLFQQLPRIDRSTHCHADSGPDPSAVDPHKVGRSTVVALIAHDDAAGVLRAVPAVPGKGIDQGLVVDPGVNIDWPGARDDPRLQACHDRLAEAQKVRIGGRLLPNPTWRLVPKEIEGTLGNQRGGLLSVHPLGGCAMGSNRNEGVVDDWGRVFDAAADGEQAVHDGLVVLDGSIVPTSLGVNPALTIAVLADRALQALRDEWGLGGSDVAAAEPQSRPVFVRDTDRARPEVPTEIEVIERLVGTVDLAGWPYIVELSLAYQPLPLRPPATLRGMVLKVRPDERLSCLRIFRAEADAAETIHDLDPASERRRGPVHEERDRSRLLLELPIAAGTLTIMQREDSCAAGRTGRGLLTLAANRGLRDLYQELADRARGDALPEFKPQQLLSNALALASRAGEVRRFDYRLNLAPLSEATATGGTLPAAFDAWRCDLPMHITGHKRLGYQRRSSPWGQLMRLQLTDFGGVPLGKRRRLDVSLSYFARRGVPLLRVTRQADTPSAFVDLASFGLYLVRVLLNNHLGSFRKPDTPSGRRPNRLPGALPGLPQPRMFTLDAGGGNGALLRLTTYPLRDARQPPVLMVHGYSASGTTFAHPALPCSLAAYLWQRGAEPWVLDLRSSAGLDGGRVPWVFEDMAHGDLPIALQFVARATGHPQIDVVSHCMGSAMLAMALLGSDDVAWPVRSRMRRWVMSQVTPAVVFSPSNLLRAFLLQYALNLLPNLHYPISGEAGPSGVSADAFDRLLGSLPYLGEGRDSEFDIENPPWWRFWQRTPWVRTRHRLDALVGRVFDARNLEPRTLAHIDDLFGDIHLVTMSQTIAIARNAFVSNAGGIALPFQRREALQRLQGLPMLSLHARHSGLADVSTALKLYDYTSDKDNGELQHRALLVENRGHQDLLIGRDADKVFERIAHFLHKD